MMYHKIRDIERKFNRIYEISKNPKITTGDVDEINGIVDECQHKLDEVKENTITIGKDALIALPISIIIFIIFGNFYFLLFDLIIFIYSYLMFRYAGRRFNSHITQIDKSKEIILSKLKQNQNGNSSS